MSEDVTFDLREFVDQLSGMESAEHMKRQTCILNRQLFTPITISSKAMKNTATCLPQHEKMQRACLPSRKRCAQKGQYRKHNTVLFHIQIVYRSSHSQVLENFFVYFINFGHANLSC